MQEEVLDGVYVRGGAGWGICTGLCLVFASSRRHLVCFLYSDPNDLPRYVLCAKFHTLNSFLSNLKSEKLQTPSRKALGNLF